MGPRRSRGGGKAKAALLPDPCKTRRLTPGNLITHLRKLEDTGSLSSEKTGSGVESRTSVQLTNQGRAALETYKRALRDLLDG